MVLFSLFLPLPHFLCFSFKGRQKNGITLFIVCVSTTMSEQEIKSPPQDNENEKERRRRKRGEDSQAQQENNGTSKCVAKLRERGKDHRFSMVKREKTSHINRQYYITVVRIFSLFIKKTVLSSYLTNTTIGDHNLPPLSHTHILPLSLSLPLPHSLSLPLLLYVFLSLSNLRGIPRPQTSPLPHIPAQTLVFLPPPRSRFHRSSPCQSPAAHQRQERQY